MLWTCVLLKSRKHLVAGSTCRGLQFLQFPSTSIFNATISEAGAVNGPNMLNANLLPLAARPGVLNHAAMLKGLEIQSWEVCRKTLVRMVNLGLNFVARAEALCHSM